MKTRILLVGAAFLLSSAAALAVPAKPGVKKLLKQPSGDAIEVTLCGDEHYSFYTDNQGNAYRLNAAGALQPVQKKEIADKWTSLRDSRLAFSRKRTAARAKNVMRVGKPGNATTGKHRGLVILIEFKDVKFVTENVHETFNRFFNEEGFHDFGNTGSVRDYFLKQSYGKLEIDFDVAGPYTANGSLAHYGASNGETSDVRPTEMVMEAIDAASKDVDFSNYDWDDDGEVDQVFIICAGYSEAEGASSDYIWPHEWTLRAQGIERNYNGKKIDTYGVATELWGNERNNPDGTIGGIGTACHEFSHCLGLPDFYDTSGGANFGMGSWSVMCSGNYNNDSHTPAGYTSYERMFSGWLIPTELKDMARINDMKPLATNPEAYILYNEANDDEYFLLENRQAVDFDEGLYGHGLLILHVDYNESAWRNNSANNTDSHQRMTIIPADGKLQHSLSSYRGDPYPGIAGNTSLTNYTSPAATVYHKNSDGRKLMNKPIDNITESSDGLISFVACRPELGVPDPDGGTEVEGQNSFTVKWPAVKDAVGYEVQVTEIGTAASEPSEALEREFDFSSMVSSTVGFTDLSSKLANYGLAGWSGSKLFATPNKMRIGTSTATGNVRTATWAVPQSTEITIVMGADVVKSGDVVKGIIRVAYGNNGEQATFESQSFEVRGDGKLIFHFQVFKDLFWIDIMPEKQMYLNYLAIYDGTWTAEQLNISTQNAARFSSPRKAAVKTYTTDTNNYTFNDVNANSRFVYRVRALGEENTFSDWSEEKTFSFSTGVSMVLVNGQSTDGVYDLQGCRLRNSSENLPKGIYIINGKKIVR